MRKVIKIIFHLVVLNEDFGLSFINICGKNISDFTGIEAFRNLTMQYCGRNPCKHLPVNRLPYLKNLFY
jgi:hypothetical protein